MPEWLLTSHDPVGRPLALDVASRAEGHEIVERVRVVVVPETERVERLDVVDVERAPVVGGRLAAVSADHITRPSSVSGSRPGWTVGIAVLPLGMRLAPNELRLPGPPTFPRAEPPPRHRWTRAKGTTARLAGSLEPGRHEVLDVRDARFPRAHVRAEGARPACIEREGLPARRARGGCHLRWIAPRGLESVLACTRARHPLQRSGGTEFRAADSTGERADPVDRAARRLELAATRAKPLGETCRVAEGLAASLAHADRVALSPRAPHSQVILPRLARLSMPSFARVAASPEGVC